VYLYALFVATSSTYGEPRSVYRDMYTIGGHDEGCFFPTCGSTTCRIGPLQLLTMICKFVFLFSLLHSWTSAVCIVVVQKPNVCLKSLK
jgi:hypothetical protein